MDEALKERATNPLNNATAFPAASTDGQADGQAAAPADSQADNAPAADGQNAE
jgi:hypothetical protein